MKNKIFIVGPVGSGKSSLARRIADEYGYVYCELDRIVYKPDSSSRSGGTKRTDEERNILLTAVLANERWIAEDSGRAVFETAWQQADSIILLEPPSYVRKYRIVSRWIKQRLGLEASAYKPGFYMLKLMFKWTRGYRIGKGGLKERLVPYIDKVSILRSEREIKEYIAENVD